MCSIFLFSCPVHTILMEVVLEIFLRPHSRPSWLSCAATSSAGHYHTILLIDHRLFLCPAIRTIMSYSNMNPIYIHVNEKKKLPKILNKDCIRLWSLISLSVQFGSVLSQFWVLLGQFLIIFGHFWVIYGQIGQCSLCIRRIILDS